MVSYKIKIVNKMSKRLSGATLNSGIPLDIEGYYKPDRKIDCADIFPR